MKTLTRRICSLVCLFVKISVFILIFPLYPKLEVVFTHLGSIAWVAWTTVWCSRQRNAKTRVSSLNIYCSSDVDITHLDGYRASKICRRADARLRKIFKNLCKICTFEREIRKQALKKINWQNFTKFFKFLHVFMALQANSSVHNF